jgi:hypothetical protein
MIAMQASFEVVRVATIFQATGGRLIVSGLLRSPVAAVGAPFQVDIINLILPGLPRPTIATVSVQFEVARVASSFQGTCDTLILLGLQVGNITSK